MNIHTDGGSKGNPGSSISLIYIDSEKPRHSYKLIGVATNNQAEYTAFIMALDELKRCKDPTNEIFTDSQLIVGHMSKGWKVNKNKELVELARTKLAKLRETKEVKLTYIPRDDNKAGQVIERDFSELPN